MRKYNLINDFTYRLHQEKDLNFRHRAWLLFWPLYWLRYLLIERLNPADDYNPIRCALDDKIPFIEYFIVPYMLWMVSMVAMCVYLYIHDRDVFRRYSKFLAISMSISTATFLLYPSCQELRPEVFPRENFFTTCVQILYAADTNTNVLPSEHAIGSIAVWLAALHCKNFKTPLKLCAVTAFANLTCFSTVFLKQHSLIDIFAAVPVCAVAYWLSYRE